MHAPRHEAVLGHFRQNIQRGFYRAGLAILLALLIGLGGWFIWRSSQQPLHESLNSPVVLGPQPPPTLATSTKSQLKRPLAHKTDAIRRYIQSSPNKLRSLYIVALLDNGTEFADELLRDYPESKEAQILEYLRFASWDPKEIEKSYELAVRLQEADPNSNMGSLLALGYQSFIKESSSTDRTALIEKVLSHKAGIWPLGQKDILEATGMLLGAGYTTDEAKSIILERAAHNQNQIAEVLKKGAASTIDELRTLSASGEEEKAINLVSQILPTIRQFAAAPIYDYQLEAYANGFEGALLKLLPADAMYGDEGLSVGEAAEQLSTKSRALALRYAKLEERIATLPQAEQQIVQKLAALEGPQKALEWMETRIVDNKP